METPLCLPLPPAGALQMSSALYKSSLFAQNKPNVKMGNIDVSAARTKAYAKKQRTINNERYSKQTQSNPIPPPPGSVRQTIYLGSATRPVVFDFRLEPAARLCYDFR
jgi:hypothetical protein